MTTIDIISDLHGSFPFLQGGDLLIVCGDLTASDKEKQYYDFWRWACYQNYRKIVVIAGNHDNFLEENPDTLQDCGDNMVYLCDSGTEFEGYKIWGSPHSLWFNKINPKCCAFTVDTDEELAEKWKLIPDDTNILITHSPPYGILDKIKPKVPPRIDAMLHVGSESLRNTVISNRLPNLKIHCFGHVHEAYGTFDTTLAKFVNASYVNENYEPVNPPIRIEL